MNRKIVILTFTISILLVSFIPNDTSAQTMVNPFEKYDMMHWNLDANMYTNEYELMTEANEFDPSDIYNINENIWDGNFATFGAMDMVVNEIGVDYVGGEYLNFIDIIGQGFQVLDETYSYEEMEQNSWDVYSGWNNWTDTLYPMFKDEMESFSDHLLMNETYIPLGIPDEPDYNTGGGPGPFWFLDGMIFDFEMDDLSVTNGVIDYETHINGMPYTLTVTHVDAYYSAVYSGAHEFQWGPYNFDVNIDISISFSYNLIYDEATGMMISHNQYTDRIVNAYYSGIVYDGSENRDIDFTYNQVSGESIHLNLNKITSPAFFGGVRPISILDGPAVVGDFFETNGYQADGQYSDMTIRVTDSVTDQLVHEDVRSEYRYNDADVFSEITIFQITDADLGVIHYNQITDLGGTSGWAEFNYDINQGGVIRNDTQDTTHPGMGTYDQMGFDIVPYEASHIPIFDYPETMTFDQWEFMQGGNMWIDPFGGSATIELPKSTTTNTFLKTYEINGYTFELLVENQIISYAYSGTSYQSIPLGDEDPLWVNVEVTFDILIESELFYDTDTGMIVEMKEYSSLYFNIYAEETIALPTVSPTIDLQPDSMDIYIDMNFEAYRDFGWELIYSTFMYLEEQTETPIDPTTTDNDSESKTNDSESSLSPIPVLELAFIAPVGMIMAIIRRRK